MNLESRTKNVQRKNFTTMNGRYIRILTDHKPESSMSICRALSFAT